MSVCVVLVTCPDEPVAKAIASDLIQNRHAACVNILPAITSLYLWEGAVCEDSEWLLVIKTTHAAFERLEAQIMAIHPYEVPEIIALPVTEGSTPYLQWVQKSVRSQS
jgi:periplasmic divalent cation tolerance protein